MCMLQLPWRTDPVHAHHGDREPRPPHPRPRHRRLPHLLLQQRLRTGQLKNIILSLNPYFSVNISRGHYTLIKKIIKFSSYIRKFRVEQLHSDEWGRASQYMRERANISPYMRRPLVIYDFATAPFWISLYMRKILFSFLSVQPLQDLLPWPFFTMKYLKFPWV